MTATEHSDHAAGVTLVAFEPAPVGQWLREILVVAERGRPGDEGTSATHSMSGWRLDDAHRFGPWQIALRWQHDEHRDRTVNLRLQNLSLAAAARTAQLDVTYTGAGDADGTAGDFAVCLSELLSQHEGGVRFVGAQAQGTLTPAASGPPPAFNLAVPGPCKQKCTFCGVREKVKVTSDPGEAFVAQLRADIVASAAAGTKVLRVNGIEPLAATYIYELMEQARSEGFEEFHVLSTFRPIDTPEAARRLLDAMPARYRFYVPLYGSCAEVHDAVTKAPGSFEQVMNSATLLREEMVRRGELDGRGQLLVTTVLMRTNLSDMHAMAMLVRPLARTWEIHLAFPNTGSRYDPYPGIAISMTEALDALAPVNSWVAGVLPLGEVTPCVALRHQRRTGHALITEEQIASRRIEPSGTYYESAGFSHSLADGKEVAFTAATVPCPRASECDLAKWCPQKVYAAYGAVFGLDELSPESLS